MVMKRALLFTLALACGGDAEIRDQGPGIETGSPVTTAQPSLVPAETDTVQMPLALPSQLYVEHDATIYARSSGVVMAVAADLGSRVSAGQILARLESTDQRIALSKTKEKLAIARQTVERQRSLAAQGFVTKAELDQVEFEHGEALLSLRQAERDLDLTMIVAPFGGVVTARRVRLHRLVSAGDTLFRLTALAPVLAAVHVPEGSAGNLRIGAEAEVVALGGISARARIVRASPMVDPASGTREIVLQLGREHRLTPGSSVIVKLGSQPRQVVAIPRTAVDDQGNALVWADDRTTLRPLTIGASVPGDRVEVISGLEAGEKVVRERP
jgi:membrane fusion protein, multidrug efflux system